MDENKRKARLALLKQIGQKHQDREDRGRNGDVLLFDGIPMGKQDIQETLGEMDTFREETRQNRGEALTSDEA